jgi:NADH:ubiquinone oxidoreductase subunit 6 (subunit J)
MIRAVIFIAAFGVGLGATLAGATTVAIYALCAAVLAAVLGMMGD